VRSHHSRHDHVGQSISLVRLHVLQAVEQLRSQVLRHGRLVLVAELRHGVELQVLEVRRVLHIIAVESPTVLQVRMTLLVSVKVLKIVGGCVCILHHRRRRLVLKCLSDFFFIGRRDSANCIDPLLFRGIIVGG